MYHSLLVLLFVFALVSDVDSVATRRGWRDVNSTGTLTCQTFENGDVDKIKKRSELGPVFATDNLQQLVSEDHNYLFLVGMPFTGTTSLLSLISTSPQVSNLCANKASTFTCEGTWILIQEKQIPTMDDRWKPNYPVNWNNALKVYERTWNLSRPVLVDKSPPSAVKMTQIDADLKRAGKRAFFIVLSRSPCTLDDDFTVEAVEHATAMATEFDEIASDQVLHIKYEDMVTSPYWIADKILQFMPALGQLDPSIEGLSNAGNKEFEQAVKEDPRHLGKDESLTGYIIEKFPFSYPATGVSLVWKQYMDIFGY